jgi:hypothetical protein
VAPRGSLPSGAEWLEQHPQGLLPPRADLQRLLDGVLQWWAYDPQHGIVGFGANLIYLSAQQLSCRVTVSAKLGECCWQLGQPPALL